MTFLTLDSLLQKAAPSNALDLNRFKLHALSYKNITNFEKFKS